MLGVGFLALLGVGVALSMGGDDDTVDVDHNEDGDTNSDIVDMALALLNGEDVDDDGYDTKTRDDLIRTYVPIGEVDEDTDASITAFLDTLDPDQPIIDAAEQYRSFVTDLGVEVIDNTVTDPEPDPSESVDPADGDDDPEDAPDYDTATRNDLIRGYVPIEAVDAATNLRIAEFLETLDPELPIIDAATEFRVFVTELGVEITGEQITDGATTTQEPGPPIGEDYRDPLQVAEELEAQRILDAIAAEIARQPVNLVTVSDITGEEVADELVLTERAEDADPEDQAFTVTAPDEANSISVNYDAEHTFNIIYTDQTTAVTAALNSNIEAPDGTVESTTTQSTDADGTPIEETVFSKVYANSTDITLNVSGEQIAEHVAQIELNNPQSTLAFDFADDVNGNFHLVFHEVEEGEEGDTSTTKRAFIVQTSSTQTALSASEVAQITDEGLARTQTTNVLAEIFLGTDSLYTDTSAGGGTSIEVLITNFINDNPQITSNIGWTSVSSHVDTDEPAPTSGGGTDDPDGGEDFVGVDNPFGGLTLNPFQFASP